MPIRELKSAVGTIIASEKSLIALEQFKAVIPPNYTRCIQHNFPDESLRILSVDSDKSLMVYELVQDGKILQVLCPTPQYVVTAGTNTVINVWEIGKGRHKRLHLKTRLYGHSEAVTCLTASQAYRIMISGSDDHTCIVWDLNRLHFIRQLPQHAAPLSCVCVNELTGDIATAAGSHLYVWTINGEPLASINTMAYSRQQTILCLAMSHLNEWDDENVILTGSSDGVVRMWSINYDQVADEPPASLNTTTEARSRATSISFPPPIVTSPTGVGGQMSVDSDNDSNEGGAAGGSNDKSRHASQTEQLADSEEEDEEENDLLTKKLKVPGAAPLNSPNGSDNFILVTDVDILEATNVPPPSAHEKMSSASDLKEGYRWERRLCFRGKLTMHTAYERKENPNPAPVTAIGISKDHKMLYVGDGRGRIFSWHVNDQRGGGGRGAQADHWIKDETVGACTDCSIRFSFAERRHHCRSCGQLFCARCTRFQTDIPRMKIFKSVRVCRRCYNQIFHQQKMNPA